MEALSEKVKITLAKAAQVAGAADYQSDVIEMSGYEGILFLTTVGAIVGGAATSLKAQQGAESDGSDMADLADTKITIADNDDGQTFALDVVKPRERYVRLFVARATQNSAFGEIYAIRYGAKSEPVTNGVADVLTIEQHVAPLEGTA